MKRLSYVVAIVTVATHAYVASAQGFKGKVTAPLTKAVADAKVNGSPAKEFSMTLTRSQMESIIKSAVDKSIKGTKLHFGHLYGRPVEVTRKNATTIHVDLDLAYTVKYFFDPEVDVDFDIRLSCQGGKLKATMLNTKVDVDSKWYADILSLGITRGIDALIEPTMQREIARRLSSQTTSLSINCVRVDVKPNGDVEIWYRR
jgi:hypothetical protein